MEPQEQGRDPVVREFRDRITATDRELVGAINRRVELVSALHVYKTERGYPLVDPGREEALRDALVRGNPGPLSNDGLVELYALVLELSKREAGALASDGSAG